MNDKGMDPSKWIVGRFDVSTPSEDQVGWGVYPPHASEPIQIFPDWSDAIQQATRFAMFAVIPPASVTAIPMRDNTIGEKEE